MSDRNVMLSDDEKKRPLPLNDEVFDAKRLKLACDANLDTNKITDHKCDEHNESVEDKDLQKDVSNEVQTNSYVPLKLQNEKSDYTEEQELNINSKDEEKSPMISTTCNLFSHLEPIPEIIHYPLTPLSAAELQELEIALEFFNSSNNKQSGWKNDWSGNLGYIDKDISNPLVLSESTRMKQPKNDSSGQISRVGKKSSIKMSLLMWTAEIEGTHPTDSKNHILRRLIRNLVRHVCTYNYGNDELNVDKEKNNGHIHQDIRQSQQHHKVPLSVVRLFSSINIESVPLSKLEEVIRRASYDPQIMQEDGWTIEKSNNSESATGGPMRIGDNIRYDGADAVVIAYIHDHDLGDLWKAIWPEDYISFDLEAEELIQAKRKWEKLHKKQEISVTTVSGSNDLRRKQAGKETGTGGSILDFTVKGIEFGIVLAVSFAKGARPGVYWPARVMHASEVAGSVKRNSSKSQKKLDVMFLSPYWNSADDLAYTVNKNRFNSSLSESEESTFNSNPLFQQGTVEAVDEMVKPYPLNDDDDTSYLDINQLKMLFRFTGLPKAAYRRFLDSYRLASSLRQYAKDNLDIIKPSPQSSASHRATAALFEAHPLAVQVPLFPPVIMQLPFSYIVSQLPNSQKPDHQTTTTTTTTTTTSIVNLFEREPVLNLKSIIEAMKPPFSWGKSENGNHNHHIIKNDNNVKGYNSTTLGQGGWVSSNHDESLPEHTKLLSRFVTDFPTLSNALDKLRSYPTLASILNCISHLLQSSTSGNDVINEPTRQQRIKEITDSWAIVKRTGEDVLSSLLSGDSCVRPVVLEWRLALEAVYCFIMDKIAEERKTIPGYNSFSTLVITDSQCNEHRTSDKCIERRVRLPAAIKAAKLAGASAIGNIRLINNIPKDYIDYAEGTLVLKAHGYFYLKRIKNRCLSARSKEETVVLTDDSDGNGGQDTRGSEGTWKAALCGVAAAVAATDMVVRGECVNAFCATRPPGHHAGRSLHPMKAVSNGFCILNPVACAAIHATTSIEDGGLGLSRVCVIDFDVHHGNGTQDILCSTFDPRFLYVSIHAGGTQMGTTAQSEDKSDEQFGLTKNPKQSGIYPGSCGDTSPHKGVLNIPLGAKVLSHAVGSALLQRVTPTVKAFSPDLIILSAGFDAHKNDPMGLGMLSADDFGNITEIACQLALRFCSGRVVSVLEGGYGVPCCRPQKDLFLPNPSISETTVVEQATESREITTEFESSNKLRPQPSKILDLGENLPPDMDDQVPYQLQVRLEKSNSEGFIECVYEHILKLGCCTARKGRN